MPQFCEVFEKRLCVFTFPTYIVRYPWTTFYRLKPTFQGNVSFNYVNPSFAHFSARNSVFDFKIVLARKHFQKRREKHIDYKQCRGYSLRHLNYLFTLVLINYFIKTPLILKTLWLLTAYTKQRRIPLKIISVRSKTTPRSRVFNKIYWIGFFKAFYFRYNYHYNYT